VEEIMEVIEADRRSTVSDIACSVGADFVQDEFLCFPRGDESKSLVCGSRAICEDMHGTVNHF